MGRGIKCTSVFLRLAQVLLYSKAAEKLPSPYHRRGRGPSGGSRKGVSNSETSVKAQSLQRSVQKCSQTVDLSDVNTTTLKNKCRQVALLLSSWI